MSLSYDLLYLANAVEGCEALRQAQHACFDKLSMPASTSSACLLRQAQHACFDKLSMPASTSSACLLRPANAVEGAARLIILRGPQRASSFFYSDYSAIFTSEIEGRKSF
jgi:hypothetical protein